MKRISASLSTYMIYACCKDSQRRTCFRFLAADTCDISSLPSLLSQITDSTNSAMSTATVHAASPAGILPVSANGRRSLAKDQNSPSQRGLRCRSIFRTLELSYAQATCHLRPPDTLARICRHCNAIHACIGSRDERSMIWHSWQRAAALPYTRTDRL
jgi:hypothetical protein